MLKNKITYMLGCANLKAINLPRDIFGSPQNTSNILSKNDCKVSYLIKLAQISSAVISIKCKDGTILQLDSEDFRKD